MSISSISFNRFSLFRHLRFKECKRLSLSHAYNSRKDPESGDRNMRGKSRYEDNDFYSEMKRRRSLSPAALEKEMMETGFEKGLGLDMKNADSRYPQWRIPIAEREGVTKSKLRHLTINPKIELLTRAQKIRNIDISPDGLFRWLKTYKERAELHDQRYIPERHTILGNDLAAAHFIVYRGGSVKFINQKEWITKDKAETLPKYYQPGWLIEAVDASGTVLYYEGLENITELKVLKWLSVAGCINLDDWCVDKITGDFYQTLEYLDLSDCYNITARGIGVLYKCDRLKYLKVDNISNSLEFQLACLMLQEYNVDLVIEGVDYLEINPEVDKTPE